ncbi:PREDICTED: uncharacterized protein LOC109147741 [Ipomoea nil]|uniref:uncharacterized protein LOC109147741 n=1 Tax=Ipomoea nil TaxID=35883 RepID=UPI000900AE23|nr:PREDICTED: uncharacterized protein LOC109147741 [Ipomoea nil]
MANQNDSTLPAGTTTSPVGYSNRSTQVVAPANRRTSTMLQQAHHYVSIKLTATNYLFWRAQLVPFLGGQNLYGCVDGTNACPPEFLGSSTSTASPTVNSLHADWVQQDQSILSMLISSLAEEVLYLAIGHSTSRGVWVATETALGSTSRSRTLSLLTQLQGLHQGDSSTSEYLGLAQILVEQLAQARCSIGLDEQNLHVFWGLRPEFRSLVASLTTKIQPLTILEVADLLNTHHYLFPEDAVPTGLPPPAVMVA